MALTIRSKCYESLLLRATQSVSVQDRYHYPLKPHNRYSRSNFMWLFLSRLQLCLQPLLNHRACRDILAKYSFSCVAGAACTNIERLLAYLHIICMREWLPSTWKRFRNLEEKWDSFPGVSPAINNLGWISDGRSTPLGQTCSRSKAIIGL